MKHNGLHGGRIGDEMARGAAPAIVAHAAHGMPRATPSHQSIEPFIGPPFAKGLLIVGDSLAMGAAEVQGTKAVRFVDPAYPEILRDMLPSLDIVVDSGVSRVTSTVCERIDGLLRAHRPAVVLVAVGGNDADCDWRRFVMSDGQITRNRVKVETYEANLRKLVAHISLAGARAILTEPSNQCLAIRGPYLSQLSGKDVVAMITAGGGQRECDRRLCEYRRAGARVALETGAEWVPCAVDIADHDPAEILCEDGTHLSAMAHRLLAASYATFLAAAFQSTARAAV